jgi:hypothetical protein
MIRQSTRARERDLSAGESRPGAATVAQTRTNFSRKGNRSNLRELALFR